MREKLLLLRGNLHGDGLKKAQGELGKSPSVPPASFTSLATISQARAIFSASTQDPGAQFYQMKSKPCEVAPVFIQVMITEVMFGYGRARKPGATSKEAEKELDVLVQLAGSPGLQDSSSQPLLQKPARQQVSLEKQMPATVLGIQRIASSLSVTRFHEYF